MYKAVILVLLSNVYTLFVTSPNLNLFKKFLVTAHIWPPIILKNSISDAILNSTFHLFLLFLSIEYIEFPTEK